jgi:hydroxypyruvate isomerase
MTWTMRYAPHLGLTSPDTPLFRHMVGSADPVEQIRFIADQGFAGIEDNFLKLRPAAEQERMGAALARAGLEMGCFVNNVESWNQPLWGSPDPDALGPGSGASWRAPSRPKRVGGKHLTTIGGRDPRVPLAFQLAAAAENLKRLAPAAEKAGVVMGIEVTNEWGFPGMLVHHVLDAYAVVKAVDSPAVRLTFDIFHVQAMDGDVIRNLERCWNAIGTVQVADNPGRLELGTGELNWPNILRTLRERGYAGLVELEHEASRPGAEGERDMLRRLREIDTAI